MCRYIVYQGLQYLHGQIDGHTMFSIGILAGNTVARIKAIAYRQLNLKVLKCRILKHKKNDFLIYKKTILCVNGNTYLLNS